MPAVFEIKLAKNKKYHFNLLAANGEIILTSQMYASKATAKKGIASVQNNAADAEQFDARENKKGEDDFVLKAKNHQIIGTSEGYSGKTGMKNGIKSVAKNATGWRLRTPRHPPNRGYAHLTNLFFMAKFIYSCVRRMEPPTRGQRNVFRGRNLTCSSDKKSCFVSYEKPTGPSVTLNL